MEQLRPYVLRVRDPMLKIVQRWREWVRRELRSAAMARVAERIERVEECERVRIAATERVDRDAEPLVAAAELPEESFRARLIVVERVNLETW